MIMQVRDVRTILSLAIICVSALLSTTIVVCRNTVVKFLEREMSNVEVSILCMTVSLQGLLCLFVLLCDVTTASGQSIVEGIAKRLFSSLERFTKTSDEQIVGVTTFQQFILTPFLFYLNSSLDR